MRVKAIHFPFTPDLRPRGRSGHVRCRDLESLLRVPSGIEKSTCKPGPMSVSTAMSRNDRVVRTGLARAEVDRGRVRKRRARRPDPRVPAPLRLGLGDVDGDSRRGREGVAGVDEDEGPSPPRFSGGRAWRRTCRSASVTGRATARERENRVLLLEVAGDVEDE